MDIPAALLYTILSSLAETALAPAPDPQLINEPAAMARMLPAEAKQGVMLPPVGDGFVIIDDQRWPLAPTAQIRSRQNLIVMPVQVQAPSEVLYLPNASGAIHRVWMLTSSEASAPRPR
ncbi:MAG: hypothetical protein H6942_13295 [Candidatus Accumulibacter sp.]|uniref:hypothetical protein n=1 Tax=Accumulibacter sp. TaxID=2053492 RepID=UPI001A03915B|nr:hypothetical protein [Accumulibacter sp.]MBE2259681.1 hypothetical protein [Paracoccaceae bacterium]MCP5249488.1 hypothetical protein [Accumulibacter sp.]